MTKRTNMIKYMAAQAAGDEFCVNPINLSAKQINDLKQLVKDGVIEPINFYHRVNEDGAKAMIRGDMLLPNMEFRKMADKAPEKETYWELQQTSNHHIYHNDFITGTELNTPKWQEQIEHLKSDEYMAEFVHLKQITEADYRLYTSPGAGKHGHYKRG